MKESAGAMSSSNLNSNSNQVLNAQAAPGPGRSADLANRNDDDDDNNDGASEVKRPVPSKKEAAHPVSMKSERADWGSSGVVVIDYGDAEEDAGQLFQTESIDQSEQIELDMPAAPVGKDKKPGYVYSSAAISVYLTCGCAT